jgi:hypothetical protein
VGHLELDWLPDQRHRLLESGWLCYGGYSLVRGSARFSCDRTHRSTRACPAFILSNNILQYKVCNIADDRSVRPLPLSNV